jgi:hypothetical protein
VLSVERRKSLALCGEANYGVRRDGEKGTSKGKIVGKRHF